MDGVVVYLSHWFDKQHFIQDIKYTSYNLSIHHGSLSLYERVNDRQKGLIKGTFHEFFGSFFPKLPSDKKFSSGRDEKNQNNTNVNNNEQQRQQPLTQAEAHITIQNYSIVQLDYGPSRHPDFIKLVYVSLFLIFKSFHSSHCESSLQPYYFYSLFDFFFF
jgi:hypothetical protein